ncbi:MAG: hypothetical protein HY682_09010 [Chloroflexi bacterium]|nr:hypothetical protein [Chloroflexota bacterium]
MRSRVDAVAEIWNLSEAARVWMHSFDLRQMEGRPAWFGSTGHDGYAGVGQAIPRVVIHELGHSMWGAFPVDGRPELLAGASGPDGVNDVMRAYRADLEAFLTQPPDRFEPLRDRFRNMPDLTASPYPGLYHAGEADLIFMTGGNIQLVPPILRKYVVSFYGTHGIAGEEFSDWAGAVHWWLGLNAGDRALAGQVFGLQHFPLDRYEQLAPNHETKLPARLARVLAAEERQRLSDFAYHFDQVRANPTAFVDATGVDRGVRFWRRYVAEMRDLHAVRPDVLSTHQTATGRKLAGALSFYNDIEKLGTEQQVASFKAREDDPLISELAMLLRPAALQTLIKESEKAIAHDSRKDEALVLRIDGLRLALSSQGADDAGEVSDAAPARLLKQAGITAAADVKTLSAGVQMLTSKSTGNFKLDQPVDRAIYDVLDRLSYADPKGVMQVFRGSGLRLQPWIETHPQRAAATFRSDISAGAELISDVADVRTTDASLIHGLVMAAPDAAAGILVQLDAMAAESRDPARATIVPRALNAFAYDAYWADLRSGPSTDLAADAAFFSRLVWLKGGGWVHENTLAGMAMYRRAIIQGDLESEFAQRHSETLAKLSGLLPATDPASSLLAQLSAEAAGASPAH